MLPTMVSNTRMVEAAETISYDSFAKMGGNEKAAAAARAITLTISTYIPILVYCSSPVCRRKKLVVWIISQI